MLFKNDKHIKSGLWIKYIAKGIFMGLMLALIFYYLTTKDFSTSPEFIYNQF